MDLPWLPPPVGFADRLRALKAHSSPADSWAELVTLGGMRLDATQTNRLDRTLRAVFPEGPPPGLATRPVQLAVLGSSTVSHLLPAIRVGALRRGIWLHAYETPFGQYRQELADPSSGLHAFGPTEILFLFDAPHALAGSTPDLDAASAEAARGQALARIRATWRHARETFRCPVVQATLLPVLPALLGSNEHRLPGSGARAAPLLNEAIRVAAEDDGVDILALDDAAARHGLDAWHDPALWRRAKQEVRPAAAPLFGDMVARLVAARQGRSRKALALDLDNTLWGGVIGDDGLAGIVLGPGSAEGEAYAALQSHIRDLAARGIVLAVVSKNDEANALAAFESHPEMVLRRADIAAFRANWDDKAQNLRRVAADLNVGLDALVFLDDNPFERDLVRRELPEVAVPELPDDPALYGRTLADAGYFEALAVTSEDRARTGLYRANEARGAVEAQAADLDGYLAGLGQRLLWSPFDRFGLPRIVQLVNKTNQFNLTTRRITNAEAEAAMADPQVVTLQLRLVDRLGDNGMIGVVIARAEAGGRDLRIETWLMSCRVFGRRVEEATLALLAEQARERGVRRLIGEYRPSARNGMVREHYGRLGFTRESEAADGTVLWRVGLADYAAGPVPLSLEAAPNHFASARE